MSAANFQSVRAQLDPQHHASFDAEMAKLDPQTQGGILTWLQKLLDFIKSLGLTFSWTCLLSVLPQAIAALSNPALWPGVLAAYFSCANTPPTP